MGIGQAIVGTTTAIMIIPGLSEMIVSQQHKYPGRIKQINSLASGSYNAFLALGQVLAPPFASFMNELVGFRLTVDIVAISCLLFGIIYFVFGSGLLAV